MDVRGVQCRLSGRSTEPVNSPTWREIFSEPKAMDGVAFVLVMAGLFVVAHWVA